MSSHATPQSKTSPNHPRSRDESNNETREEEENEDLDDEEQEGELPPKKKDDDEEPKVTLAEKIRFYRNVVFVCMAIGSFTAFIFTVPFDIDPALSTINHDFVGPINCTTISAEHYTGSDNCTSKDGWASCREGCTKEFYECDRLYVTYVPNDCYGCEPVEARLLVNVKGCGYPPNVRCWEFWQNYHNINHVFECWYSQMEEDLCITDFVEGAADKQAIISFVVPIGLFVISMIYISLKFCVCCQRHIDLSHLELNEDLERGEDDDASLQGSTEPPTPNSSSKQ